MSLKTLLPKDNLSGREKFLMFGLHFFKNGTWAGKKLNRVYNIKNINMILKNFLASEQLLGKYILNYTT